jgi:PAP_fibrillin
MMAMRGGTVHKLVRRHDVSVGSDAARTPGGMHVVLQVNNWQIIGTDEAGNPTVENRVALGVGTVRAVGTCTAESDTRTGVKFEKVVFDTLGRQFPINMNRDAAGFIDWVYVDERIRVSKGNRGSVFIHTRELE